MRKYHHQIYYKEEQYTGENIKKWMERGRRSGHNSRGERWRPGPEYLQQTTEKGMCAFERDLVDGLKRTAQTWQGERG